MGEVGITVICVFGVVLIGCLLVCFWKRLAKSSSICSDNTNSNDVEKRKKSKETSYIQSDDIDGKQYSQLSYQNSRPAYILNRGISVTVIQADITEEDVDVIVNAANGRLQHGGGVARAIALKAGDAIHQEGQRELGYKGGELDVTEVLHTGGYKLQAKHVIHAVGPIKGKDNPFPFLLKKTFLNCLEYAEQKLEASSIAIPLISSGIFGGNKNECAESLVQAIIIFSENGEFKNLNEIRLVNIDKEASNAIDTILSIELEKNKQK